MHSESAGCRSATFAETLLSLFAFALWAYLDVNPCLLHATEADRKAQSLCGQAGAPVGAPDAFFWETERTNFTAEECQQESTFTSKLMWPVKCEFLHRELASQQAVCKNEHSYFLYIRARHKFASLSWPIKEEVPFTRLARRPFPCLRLGYKGECRENALGAGCGTACWEDTRAEHKMPRRRSTHTHTQDLSLAASIQRVALRLVSTVAFENVEHLPTAHSHLCPPVTDSMRSEAIEMLRHQRSAEEFIQRKITSVEKRAYLYKCRLSAVLVQTTNAQA